MNRRIRLIISPLVVLCCPLLAQIASGSTVTVVTHGLDPFGLGGPLYDMGDELFDYWNTQPGGAVEYEFTQPFGLNVRHGTAGNANKIIVFDWADESDRWQGGYDEAAGDTLFTMLKAWNFLNSDYLHLIGHSRGTIVVSEAAQRILHHGYSVNQLTFLDTEPGPTPFNKAGKAQAWGGVDFVDNYYGNGDWWSGTLLKGEPVDGAYDRHLSTDHSGVHEWYTATINDPNATDGYCWRTNAQSRPTATGSPTPVIPPPDVVNGNFEYGVVEVAGIPELKATMIAGWDKHGGSGTGHVDSDEDNRYNLELDWSDTWKTHNWLYVPENADKLVFSVTVENLSLNDYFALVMDRIDGYNYEYWPLSLKERTGWITYEVPIQDSPLKDFAGSVCRMKFSLNGGAITSQVSIDGIHFEYLPGSSNLTSLRSGNWNNAATWIAPDPDASTIPDASTDVVVEGGYAVKVHIAGQAAHVLEVDNGSVSVSGELSVDSLLYVGRSGSGTLTVSGGGSVVDDIGQVGYDDDSIGTVTVDGPGSTWESTNYVCVGRNGNGTLTIIGGGHVVVATDSSVGARDGSHGTVTVDGEQSVWENERYLYIGFDTGSEGTLRIKNGGSVSNAYGYIGHVASSQGSVSVTDPGSTWTNSDDLYVGRYGTGTLEITEGGLVSVARTLTIDYDTDGDSFVNMASGGMLALFGDADDSLTEYLGLISGTDAINYWDDSISDWADIMGATYGQTYTLSYLSEGDLAGYTVLTVTAVLVPGDANGDGVVDNKDASILGAHWLQTGNWLDGDFNDDGYVNDADAAILAAHWGEGMSEESVPEPGNLALLAGIAVMVLVCRRRRKA